MAADTIKLLRRDSPRPDESLMGYILRLTELNGYETPSWIMKSAGLDYSQLRQTCSLLFQPPENLCQLAEVAGITVPELAPLMYSHVSSPGATPLFSFCGAPVPKYVLRPARPKVCPHCLSATGYCRRIWDLLPLTTCLYHECLLIDQCPECEWRITWIRNGVSICRSCGLDLRESPIKRVKDSELELARHIHRLCDLPAAGGAASPDEHKRSQLLGLSLGDLLSILLFTASLFNGPDQLWPWRYSLPVDGGWNNEESHSSLLKAYSVFEDWPEGYYSFLHWMRPERGNASGSQPSRHKRRKDLEKIRHALSTKLSASQFDFMREAFKDYLELPQRRLFPKS